jgi:hypothetical protein
MVVFYVDHDNASFEAICVGPDASKMIFRGGRGLKTGFLIILASITTYSTHKSHSWTHIVTLWATIATHLWAKMDKNGWKQVFDNTYLHNTQVYSMGQLQLFKHPMVSPKVSTTLMTPYCCLMGHYSHSFISKNLPKTVKNRVLTILTSITSYSTDKSVLWANKWCSIILWYQPKCLLHSWPHVVTLWATIAIHL